MWKKCGTPLVLLALLGPTVRVGYRERPLPRRRLPPALRARHALPGGE